MAQPAMPLGSQRPLALLIVIVLSVGALVARLVFWQVMQHDQLTARAAAQRAALLVQAPLRGGIYDAEGDSLATNITKNLVYAVPRHVATPVKTAERLAPMIHQPVQALEDIFSGSSNYPVLISGDVSDSTSSAIDGLHLPGIVLGPQIRRAYPARSFASQLLGYANFDNQGNYGIEGQYDSVLSGKAGLRSVLKDTAGRDIHLAPGLPIPSHNGADLHLALSGAIQGLVEDELHKAVKAHSADGGTIIVMDPSTGYLLGMASTPSYDPTTFPQTAQSNASLFQNPAIQWTYEPGSTFKIVTMAAGLDAGVITPQSSLYDPGTYTVGSTVLHDWNMVGFGHIDMTQVLQHSANVGASWVANRLGVDRFYQYMHRFHFDRPTGVDLQGEDTGLLPLPGQKSWTIVNLYTNSFGQGIGVTPLQLLQAVATVANHGVMMKPQVVQQVVYDGHVVDHPPVREGRVISAATARTVTTMLVHSAIDGEASAALVKGYDIAAKTGTANIADSHGGYVQGATNASIVGYAPAFNPRFVALVILRHPRDTPWGSTAAAPVLHNLFSELFLHFHIPPSPTALNK